MAHNVFGTPLTNATLQAMPEYKGKDMKRSTRALAALNLKNAENKDRIARQYLEKMRDHWGDRVTTQVLIYNATGNSITLVTHKDWDGNVAQSPLPVRIENGQWAAVLHGRIFQNGSGADAAALVYRDKSSECDFMVAWLNQGQQNNKAYTEIREAGHYDKNDHWDYIHNVVQNSKLYGSDKRQAEGIVSTISIGNGSTAVFEAIFFIDA